MRYKQKTRAGAASADYPTEQLPSSARVWRHAHLTRDSTDAEVAAIKRKPDGASKKSSLGSSRKGKRVARERFGGKRRALKEVDEEHEGDNEEEEQEDEEDDEGYEAGRDGDSEMGVIEESDEELEAELEPEQPIASTSTAVLPPPRRRFPQPQSRDLESQAAHTSDVLLPSVPFTSPYVYGRRTAPAYEPLRVQPPPPTTSGRSPAEYLQALANAEALDLIPVSFRIPAPPINPAQIPYPPISALAALTPVAPEPLPPSFENSTLLPPRLPETSSFPSLKRRLQTLRPTDPSNSTLMNPPPTETYYYSSSANSNDSQGSVSKGIGFDNVWVFDTPQESQESSAGGGNWRERHPYVTKGSQSSQSWPKLNRGASELVSN